MFAYKRLDQLFYHFYRTSTCTMEELTEHFSISQRTVRNDIKELNNELQQYQASIVTLRGVGYRLHNKENVTDLINKLTKSSEETIIFSLETTEDRIKTLLYFLLTTKKYLTVDELCAQVFVGRTTLMGYLKQLKDLLQSYELVIVSKTNLGYKIVGKEVNIRQCFAEQIIERNFDSYISQFSTIEQNIFKNINLQQLFEKTIQFLPPNEYKITDYNRKNFVIHLAIAILRVQSDDNVEEIKQLHLFDAMIQESMDQLISWIERTFDLSFTPNDKKWIYAHFFSGLQYQTSSAQHKEEIYQIIQHLLEEIKQTFGVNLLADTVLSKDLFAHFSSYLPLKEVLTIKKNPLLSAIKKNYSYAFELTVMAVSKNESLKKYHFTEDDIGYIALHIAAAIERKTEASSPQKKVLIVCGQGLSSSRLLEAIIRKNFPKQLQIIDTISFASYQLQKNINADFIISTIPLSNVAMPVIQFDFMETKKGIQEIQKLLEQGKKNAELYSLFEPQFFFINDEEKTKEQLILSLGEKLEEKNLASSEFVQKVIEREAIVPTNVTSFIAIPHAIDKGITKTKIIVCISKVPIKWTKNDSVKIIFLIAGADNDKERLQTFFENLSELVEDPKLQKNISTVQNFTDFIYYLSKV